MFASHALKRFVRTGKRDAAHNSTHLDPPHLAGGLHPGGHVDGVAPDVVLRLLRTHDPGHHAALIQTRPQNESLKAVAIDVFQKRHQLDGELDQNRAVIMLSHDLDEDKK